uniref:DNA replication ATP-dependent helicase/nuclease DNA2 n=1 Tax=Plectus sambesii TaxID=2011161 RepID=A0A914UU51_9BILA
MLRPLGCSQVNRTDSTSPRTVENGAASDSENQISRKRPATDTPYEHSSLSNADFGGSIKRQASPDSPAPESEPLTAVRPLLDDSFENTDLDDELLRCVDDAERDAQTTATSTNSSTSFFPKVSRSRELKVLEADGDHCETRLKCSCFSTGSIVLVSLRGLWAHTAVKVGAKIRVFGPNIGLNSKDDDVIIIDDYSGLLVYDPDTLVPCTTVTSGVFCRRKAVLSDRFKGGCGAPSKQMFVGTIVHELFQSAIRRRPKFLTESWLIGEVRRSILSSTGYVEQLVGMRLSPAELEKEIKPYLRPIVTWIHKYMPPPLGQAQGLGAMRIEEVRDIEENIWCPTFGVRGKIDVSLKMTTGDQSVATISPLELKTGKSSNSADHRAQVLLYCLMLSSLTNNEEECTGNLLYLRDGETFPVTLTPASLNGVMQMRNDLAFQLADLIDDNERVTAMPAPFVDVRSCQNCEQLVNCCLYQRTFEKDANTASDSMAALATAVLASVTDLHVAYFERWVRWICLEWTQSMKSKLDKRDTWLQPAVERESKGECLSSLVVESVTSCNNQQTAFIIAFKRQDGSALCSNIISKGELVVASVESKKMFACLMGSVVEISDSHISIQSDKPLRDSSGIFRIDKYESFATFQYNLSNLTRLMQSDLASVRLRELLIDRRAPSFGKMSKQEMEVVRTIVRGLNREQISAVVKVLVAHDYVLIKGLPGSEGKS